MASSHAIHGPCPTTSWFCAVVSLLLSLAPGASVAADSQPGEQVSVHRRPWALSIETQAFAGAWRRPLGDLSLPMGDYLLLETHTARRDRGLATHLGLFGDPLDATSSTEVLQFELFWKDIGQRLDLRAGRLGLVHGGRFRFVDGASTRLMVTDGLAFTAWGGAAWHPERTAFFAGGPTWGASLGYRGASPLAGSLRYEQLTTESGRWAWRIGADAALSLPRAAGLLVETRIDLVPSHRNLETAAVAAELRPAHRLHLRLEGGVTQPLVDDLPAGGALYPVLHDGPTVYGDGRIRIALAPGALTVDGGALGVHTDEGLRPAGRAALGLASHPGRPWRHLIRLSGLHGSAGSVALGLIEIGRRIGPLDLAVTAENAFYRSPSSDVRALPHLGAQVAVLAHPSLRISITGQLEPGSGAPIVGRVFVFVTYRLRRGPTREPALVRERYLSPWSPYRWQRDDMPRSPGTVPGADPYPSVPTGGEDRG